MSVSGRGDVETERFYSEGTKRKYDEQPSMQLFSTFKLQRSTPTTVTYFSSDHKLPNLLHSRLSFSLSTISCRPPQKPRVLIPNDPLLISYTLRLRDMQRLADHQTPMQHKHEHNRVKRKR
jgi:hypothetical protein